MAITPLPDAPQRTEPSTFSTKADAFVAALPTFGTEANALAAEVNGYKTDAEAAEAVATASAATAQASANFKGNWSDQTGAATIPYSVYHEGNYWQLVSNLADVTASEPGVTAAWEIIGGVILADDLDQLQSFSVVDGAVVYLKGRTTSGDGGQGVFVGKAGDFTTQVTSDTRSGVYAPSDADPTGALGCWVRQLNGYPTPPMFGVLTDGSDTSTAFAAWSDFCDSINQEKILSDNATYNVATGYYSNSVFYGKDVTILNNSTISVFSQYGWKERNEARLNKIGAYIVQGLNSVVSVELCLIGDSITAGSGASDIFNTSYAGLLRTAVNNAQNGHYGLENSFTFGSPSVSNITSHTGTIGTKGPVGESIVLDVGESIFFSGAYQIIKVFYQQTLASGNIEVYRDGSLVDTLSLAGAAEDDALSSTAIDGQVLSSAWELRCINAPAEITGLVRQKMTSVTRGVNISRLGNGGTTTTSFVPLVSSIKKVADWESGVKIFLLALGTNNIYSSVATTVAVFKSELESLITGLSSSLGFVVLTIPPKPVESTWPPIYDTYDNYVRAIIELADKYDASVIDYRDVDLSPNLYADGVHPNSGGHSVMAGYLMSKFKIPSSRQSGSLAATGQPTFNDTWGDFSSGSEVRFIKRGNIVYLTGLAMPNGSSATTILTVPSGFSPSGRNIFISVATDSGSGTLTVHSSGTISIDSVPTTWVSFDGISYPIYNNRL
jgi:lysophospholipase L1-like esterase